MRRREFNKNLAAATAVALSPFPRIRSAIAASGATPVFSYPNGFAGSPSGINLYDAAGIHGSAINLITNGQGHNHGSAWYATRQPPGPFTTQFTFQISALGSGPAQSGLTFCVQNFGVVDGDANMCGYGGGITQGPPVDSIAIKFDASTIGGGGQVSAPGRNPSSTGLYFNGGPSVAPGGSLGLLPFNDLIPYDIDFYSGDTYAVTIVYDGSLLTMVIRDTSTNAQARFEWPLNLANTTNPTGNYVGFTGGTASIGTLAVLNWSYWSGYNTRLATPTFNPPPGQYSGSQTVTISYPPGSTCYYTTNGLLPTSASTQYSGSITVSANEVIQAVAIQSGYTDSLVAAAAYEIDTSNVINFPSGFSAGDLISVGYAYLSGSAYRVSDNQQGTAGAVWFPIPVTVSSFSTTFTLQWGGEGQGMCFVIQNNPPAYTTPSNAINWSGGPTVVGAIANALGYGGMNANNGGTGGTSYGLLNSIAIAFNQWPGSNPGNSIGLYTNGATPSGSQISTGLNFGSGHPFTVILSYSGSTLSFSMTDKVTGATFTHSFTVNIPSTVGGNTAYVGFTGGTGGAATIQAVQTWTHTASLGQTPAVPAPPTNLQVK
jgi:hypothetical protein